MTQPLPHPIPHTTHLTHLRHTIDLATQSPPLPTNFRVGCVIVSDPSSLASSAILSTGYTLELAGNTHAEQCALAKLPSTHAPNPPSQSDSPVVVLYTSLEPCSLRLSGATSCVSRILTHNKTTTGFKIDKVVFGAKEPGTFVRDSQSCALMSEAGLDWEYIADYEEEILRVAMEGHKRDEKGDNEVKEEKKETRIDDVSPEERKRQEALPKNPKKRMMEGPPPQSQSG